MYIYVHDYNKSILHFDRNLIAAVFRPVCAAQRLHSKLCPAIEILATSAIVLARARRCGSDT